MQAIVIGNFDGVHRGHQALFQLAREAVGSGRVVAVTFEPLPIAVLQAKLPVIRLTPSADRARLLRERCGIDDLLELMPSAQLLGRNPQEFIADLHARVRFDVVVEGPDFRFGHGRSGSLDTLRELGVTLGFRVIEAPVVSITLFDGTNVQARSSVTRDLLAQGRVHDAARVLGRAYELRCLTTRGDQRGRTIGWPTMNLNTAGLVLPADGVYSGEATLPDGRTAIAAISMGTKPTFGESARTCETTLLQRDGTPLSLPLDWYDFPLALRFHQWIRGQVRFSGVETLLAQMELDRAAVMLHATQGTDSLG